MKRKNIVIILIFISLFISYTSTEEDDFWKNVKFEEKPIEENKIKEIKEIKTEKKKVKLDLGHDEFDEFDHEKDLNLKPVEEPKLVNDDLKMKNESNFEVTCNYYSLIKTHGKFKRIFIMK
jgi:hypothetical protein